jgi:putative phosphoesterase
MVASVAVLSDVHGTLPVLDAVLAEPDLQACDKIVITGDHVAGPMPGQVLDRFAELGDQLILVRGNADREVVSQSRGTGDERAPAVSIWAATQLSGAQLDLLDRLPHPVTLEVDGFGSVVFCHGTPRDDDEVVLVDTRIDKWAEVFADLPGEVKTVVCGHTHMPFTRLVDRRWVVNPGSIGMPYGRVGTWALLADGQISLRQTRLDLAEMRRQVVDGSAFPEVDQWVADYLSERISDVDAITIFGPRDGR